MFNQSGTTIIIYFEVIAVKLVEESGAFDRDLFLDSDSSPRTKSGCILVIKTTTR